MTNTPVTALGQDPARRGSRRRRIALYCAVVVVIIIGGGAAYFLRPDYQRSLLLEKAAPYVEAIAVAGVRITPWSVALHGVDVTYKGGKFHLGKVELGVNPLALLNGTVSIRHLYVRHTDLDLRHWQSAPSTAPFAGVLPSLNLGYGLALNNIDVVASILLPAEQAISVHVSGGGVREHVAGALNIAASYTPLKSKNRIDAEGTLGLNQLSQGRFRAVTLDAAIHAAIENVQLPDRLRLKLAIAPPPGIEGSAYRTRRIRQPDGRVVSIPNPEALTGEVLVGDDATPNAATITLNGLYRGEDGVVTVGYRILTSAELLRVLAIEAPTPSFNSELRGAVQFETLTGKGLVTLESTTDARELERVLGTNPTLPLALSLKTRSSGTFDRDALQLNETMLTLNDAASERARFALAAPVNLTYAAPLALLQSPRLLASLKVGPLPLNWVNGKTGDLALAGVLQGEYALRVDEHARLRLEASDPTSITGLGATQGAQVLAADLTLEIKPSASWSTDFTRVAAEDLTLSSAGKTLFKTTIQAATKHVEVPPITWRVRTQGALDVDALLALPIAHARVGKYQVPAKLAVNFKALLAQRERTLTIEKLEATGTQPEHPQLLTIKGLQAFHIALEPGATQANPLGDLAQVEIRGFDLSWLNALLVDLKLSGQIAAVAATLRAPDKASFVLQTTVPLKIEGLEVQRAGKPLVQALNITVTPKLVYNRSEFSAELTHLTTNAHGVSLLQGDGMLAVHDLGTPRQTLTTSGHLASDLLALARQPMVLEALARELPKVPIGGTFDFALSGTVDTLKLSKGQGELKIGEQTRIRLTTESGLEIRTRLASGENLARHIIGSASLEIANLTSSILGEFVPLTNISFAEINSKFELKSDGSALHATSLAPLAVRDVQITDGTKPLLKLFSASTTANITVEQQEVRSVFNDISLAFHDHPDHPAVKGDVVATLVPGETVPLQKLAATLTADLPQLFAQPAAIPGHKLTAGELTVRVAVDEKRKIDANVVLDKLVAATPLAISTFELPMTGTVAADGRGFDFTAPLIGRGKSGVTNATVIAHYAPQLDELRVLHLDIASEVFYLNDILATVAAINPHLASVDPTASNPKQQIKLNEVPDTAAAWKVIGPALVIDLKTAKLFYTDYLAFTEVAAHLDLRRHKFALTGVKAHFHDSAIAFDSVSRFKDADAEPYDLNATGTIEKFNLNQFFTELVPGQKPRIEGLFGVKIKSFGKFPNFSQLRNRVLFDIAMESRDGLFRPLPPDSTLLVGASDVLGVVGEGLSYVPTGGFGAGAIARLINYIAEINYDTIDIHLVRDTSKDVRIEQFLVLSPTIALSAKGGITALAGHDIVDSPLSLTANLDMLGRGAAILYSMDLMQDAQNEQGYWRGPEFKIIGTAADPQSNFAEIVQRASDGAVQGAITRPISGLIGNLKYRWFNNDSRAKEAAQAARRAKQAAPSTLPAAPPPADTDTP